jgi:outer membrane immunogenic protein
MEAIMKLLLIAGAWLLALAAAAPVAAADIPARMATKGPIYAAPYNWSGLYAGLNGGGAWGTSSWTTTATGVSTGDFNPSGGMIGATLGYNWQQRSVVLGVETDLDWSRINGSTGVNCPSGSCETRNSYFGTLRGRLGYAWDRLLPYVTGGLAYGNVKYGDGLGSGSTAKAGWTIGGGVEFALSGPWSAKIEYLYASLGTATCGTGVCAAASPVDVKFTTNVLRGGINYRF